MIGCGYIFVQWIITGNVNDEMCGISHFDITSSYGDVSENMMTSVINYNFTGLPDDALFSVIVVAFNLIGNFIDLDSTSVRTMVIESMYTCVQLELHVEV